MSQAVGGAGAERGTPLAAPLVPDYRGACLSNLVPALLGTTRPAEWLPEPAVRADQVVLFMLDGLGWLQLQDRWAVAPTLAAMTGGPIHSVAPTTTACALASLTLGQPPAVHGIVGYRLRVDDGQVMNVLRWRTADGDARERVPPQVFQALPAFGGRPVPVVTRAEFEATGFTIAHLGGTRLRGWREASSIAVEVRTLLLEGQPLVYVYYDGIDHVAHDRGFGAYYDAELLAVDRLVGDVIAALPAGAAVVVTGDHGQVEVGDRLVSLPEEVLELAEARSGEGRFTWLHAKAGCVRALEDACRSSFAESGQAWVATREEAESAGWFGGRLAPTIASRLGDVAVVARQAVAFVDPADHTSARLRCRHGSLTAEEVLVPLLAVG